MPGRALVIGTGRVGTAYAAVLDEAGADVALVDSATEDPGERLATVRPQLVVVATPPGIATALAKRAAVAGAVVLVAHPGGLTPGDTSRLGTLPVFLAAEAHFCPAVTSLLTDPEPVQQATLTLMCHRPTGFYTRWRANRASGGGILHQQVLPPLSLITRLLSGAPAAITGLVSLRDGNPHLESSIDALCRIGNANVAIAARTDLAPGSPASLGIHLVTDQAEITLSGASWLGALAEPDHSAHQQHLRRRMCAAAMYLAHHGVQHPSLLPMSEATRTLHLITELYRTATLRRRITVPQSDDEGHTR